ncbi:hypothetical protein [Domibacillus epiphyticus]|uniref:Uncharacterized protein n=1 Tax=Domibacillus epiphyticus TaxID=1714355 RepID=A0A1V2ABD7_9BACI|nr:hypothetical protein [Domibacillus epiphyticus]OMP68313.1 hypothetical protein BTO28_02560 [Domibacillus epiphyticus]
MGKEVYFLSLLLYTCSLTYTDLHYCSHFLLLVPQLLTFSVYQVQQAEAPLDEQGDIEAITFQVTHKGKLSPEQKIDLPPSFAFILPSGVNIPPP